MPTPVITDQQYMDTLYDRRDELLRQQIHVRDRISHSQAKLPADRSPAEQAWLIRGEARLAEIANTLEMIDGRIEQANEARSNRFASRFVSAAKSLLSPDVFRRLAQTAQREGGAG